MTEKKHYFNELKTAFNNLKERQFNENHIFQLQDLEILKKEDLFLFQIKTFNKKENAWAHLNIGCDLSTMNDTVGEWENEFQKEDGTSSTVSLCEIFLQQLVAESLDDFILHVMNDEDEENGVIFESDDPEEFQEFLQEFLNSLPKNKPSISGKNAQSKKDKDDDLSVYG